MFKGGKRFLTVAVSLMTISLVFGLAHSSYAATVTFVSGQVTDNDGSPVVGLAMSLHTGNGDFSIGDVTDTDGNYSVIGDDTSAIGESLTLEFTAPDGYVQPNNVPFMFNYNSASDANQTQDFELVLATKVINVTVVTVDGAPIEYADVQAAPIEADTSRSAGGTMNGGVGSIDVSGGKWAVVADRNLSEQNPSRYPWIAIGGAQLVEFSRDSSVESIDLTFEVVTSDQLVTVHPVDANGDDLTQNSFNADVAFTGYSSTYGSVSTQAKVNSDTGIASIYLLPGIWKMEMFHNSQLEMVNQAYDPADLTFVVPDEAGTYDLGTIQALLKTGSISGTVTEFSATPSAQPQAIGSNVEVRVTNLDTGSIGTGSTDTTGAFSIANLGPGEYAVSVSADNFINTSSAHVTLTQDNNAITGVELEAIRSDMTINGSVEQSNVSIENLPASVKVETADRVFTAPVEADGSFSINLFTAGLTSDTVAVQLVTQPEADYYQAETITVPVTANSTQEVSLEVAPDNATITGTVVDAVAGGNVTDTEIKEAAEVVAINTTTGATETTTIASDGSFELAVGPGDWKLLTKIGDTEATALTSLVSDTVVTVAADETTPTVELPVLVATGEVTGSITDPDGNAVAEAPVVITNLPALQAAATTADSVVDPADIITVSTSTKADGSFTANVPAGDFVAYIGANPETTAWTTPVAQDFSVTNGQTATINAEYREATSTASGTVSEDLQSASVTFYSEAGGTVTMPVDENSNYTGVIAPGEWNVVVSGVKDGELWRGDDSAVVTAGDNTVNLTVATTNVAFPASVSTTGEMDETVNVSTPDGASVSLPAYSAGLSGQITVEIAPNPSIAVSGGVAQVGLSYDVTVRDEDGIPITQLDRPATVTLPINETLAGAVATEEIMPGYYVPEMDAYLYSGMVSNVKEDEMVIYTTHFTRFSASTVPTAQIESDTEIIVKPKKPNHLTVSHRQTKTVRLHWRKGQAGDTVTRYLVQLRKKQKPWKKSLQTIRIIKPRIVAKHQKNIKDLKPATVYRFRVKACNTAGCSKYSDWKNFQTKAKTD